MFFQHEVTRFKLPEVGSKILTQAPSRQAGGMRTVAASLGLERPPVAPSRHCAVSSATGSTLCSHQVISGDLTHRLQPYSSFKQLVEEARSLTVRSAITARVSSNFIPHQPKPRAFPSFMNSFQQTRVVNFTPKAIL